MDLGILHHLTMYYMKEEESFRGTSCTHGHEMNPVLITKKQASLQGRVTEAGCLGRGSLPILEEGPTYWV